MPKELIPDEKQEKQEELSNVTIKLDDKGQPIKQEEKKEDPKYVTADVLAATVADALKKATAPLYYELRKTKDEVRPVQQIQAQPKEEPTEWDTKLQKNWKGTVEELADSRVEAILKKREEAQRLHMESEKTKQILEANKKSVLDKHQELNDEGSQKAQIYRQVMQERPDYLLNSYGPILVMREMEDRLRDMGVVDSPTQRVVEKEVARQVRTNAGGIPKGAPINNGKSITLTKDQKEFCDANNIKYESYARFSKMQSQTGVEV